MVHSENSIVLGGIERLSAEGQSQDGKHKTESSVGFLKLLNSSWRVTCGNVLDMLLSESRTQFDVYSNATLDCKVKMTTNTATGFLSSIITIVFPLELHTTLPSLLRLTSVRPPTLFLVSRHTGSKLDVNPRRGRETEGL